MITYLIRYAITYAMTYAITYVIMYVITYANTHAITYAITCVLTYETTYVTTYGITIAHPNLNSISSAKPHPQPPYQASAWSYIQYLLWTGVIQSSGSAVSASTFLKYASLGYIYKASFVLEICIAFQGSSVNDPSKVSVVPPQISWGGAPCTSSMQSS